MMVTRGVFAIESKPFKVIFPNTYGTRANGESSDGTTPTSAQISSACAIALPESAINAKKTDANLIDRFIIHLVFENLSEKLNTLKNIPNNFSSQSKMEANSSKFQRVIQDTQK